MTTLYDFISEYWGPKVPKARSRKEGDKKVDDAGEPQAEGEESVLEPGASAQAAGAEVCPEAASFEEAYPVLSDHEEETPEAEGSSGDVTPTSSIRLQQNELLAFTLGGDLLSPAKKETPRLVEQTPSSPSMLEAQLKALEQLGACGFVGLRASVVC